MKNKEKALGEMKRVLKPGGKLLILEFSKVWKPIKKLYDVYLSSVVPWLGERVAKNRESYHFLAETIREHPDQETLVRMMQMTGFIRVDYFNLTAGIAALHTGLKI
jgi:demethylmenaquinone methyltransferase/2-methoxy-6-polyprenyl-1,4-benzoquinol methylase